MSGFLASTKSGGSSPSRVAVSERCSSWSSSRKGLTVDSEKGTISFVRQHQVPRDRSSYVDRKNGQNRVPRRCLNFHETL